MFHQVETEQRFSAEESDGYRHFVAVRYYEIDCVFNFFLVEGTEVETAVCLRETVRTCQVATCCDRKHDLAISDSVLLQS